MQQMYGKVNISSFPFISIPVFEKSERICFLFFVVGSEGVSISSNNYSIPSWLWDCDDHHNVGTKSLQQTKAYSSSGTCWYRTEESILLLFILSLIAFSSQILAILPLAVAHTFGNLLTNVSLGKVAVSFTHTIKALEPFFTVLFAALFLGEVRICDQNFTILPL